ncbi:DUF1697 domain-containing protein [Arthrobacter sp. Z1-9]
MGSYAVFLRGINVGGINVTMADLRGALKDAGFSDARTLLASGNVVLASSLDAAAVKRECEKCLRDAFGYDAWVVVLDAGRVAELVEACPYPDDDKSTHTYITLSSDQAMLDELDAAGAALDGTEQTRLGPEALAWLAPAGGTLDSPFSKISAKARFKASTTTRNLRTMIKVRDAAAELAAGSSIPPRPSSARH